MRRVGLVVLVALLGAPVMRVAEAAEDPESLILLGNELRRKGQGVRAHGYFKRAYELSPTPRTAAQLGLSFYAIGQFVPAEALLSEALAGDDPWVQSQRAILENTRKGVRSHLGAITIAGAPAGATVAVSDRPASRLAPGGIVWVAPGESRLRIESAGHQAMTRTLTLVAGEKTTVRFDAPALTPAPTVTAAPLKIPAAIATTASIRPEPTVAESGHHSAGRTGRITGVALAGVAVAAGVTGLIMRDIAHTKLSAIQDQASTVVPYDERNGDWRTYDRVGIGMLAGGATVFVAGAVLFLINWPRSASTSEERLSFGLRSNPTGGATIEAAGRF